MAEFPYSPSSGDLSKVLKKVQDDRPPDKLEEKFLQAAGVPKPRWGQVTSSLKLLGFTDASGVPTQRWLDYRDRGKTQAVLAEAIREGFAPLYADNPEAHLLSSEDLTSAFAAKGPVARGTGEHITKSFRNLCKLAGLPIARAAQAKPPRSKPKQRPAGRKDHADPPQPVPSPTPVEVVNASTVNAKGSIPITINVQLTLPETKDPEVYNLFFEALKKHLLPD